jgi:cysteine desulfurase
LFPIRRVAEIVSARGTVLHVDAVQTVGRIAVDVADLGANLLSASAHKMHGPKGAGALYVGRRTRLRSQLMGGHQERDIRPGTQNVAAIVGFGVAARRAREWIGDGSWGRVAGLRDRLEREIHRRVPCASVIGDPAHRVPNTSNIAFESLEAEAILIALSEEGLCASSGSACSSGSLEPSHVLKAMGIEQRVAHGAIRFSLSVDTTDEEIDAALEIVPRVIGRLSGSAPNRRDA